MPTVLRDGRFVVKVYGPPREHPPAHAHVEVGKDGVAVVRLSLDEARPVTLWSIEGKVSLADATKAVRLVEQHEHDIRAAWERIHG